MNARKAKTDDFIFDVDGVGRFRFGRRTMADEMNIRCEYSRIVQGMSEPAPALEILATCVATERTMLVEAPDGWDIEAMDPSDPETERRIIAVIGAYRAKERQFREGKRGAGEKTGPGTGSVDGVLVPAQVQSPAE